MRIKMEPIGLNVDLLRPGFNLQRFTENVLMQEARALEVDYECDHSDMEQNPDR